MNERPTSVEEKVALAPRTTLKVGGAAEYFAAVTSTEELQKVLLWATANNVPVRVLGGGSNILVPDEGVPGLVIHIAIGSQTVQEELDEVLVTYGAGFNFDECVAETVAKNWWGLENLSHIPGTVGATPIQNVGAYGVEVADVIENVTAYDTRDKKSVIIMNDECGFAYRNSRFKSIDAGRYIVTHVTFRLSKQPKPVTSYKDVQHLSGETNLSPQTVRQTVIAIRAQKFPDWTTVGTAGSFFKNPIVSKEVADELKITNPELPIYPVDATTAKLSLGFILDKICHLRGHAIGKVGLYEAQALVLVASAGATAKEIDEFANQVAQSVYEKTGVVVEREVVRW